MGLSALNHGLISFVETDLSTDIMTQTALKPKCRRHGVFPSLTANVGDGTLKQRV